MDKKPVLVTRWNKDGSITRHHPECPKLDAPWKHCDCKFRNLGKGKE